jgi:hypothetical protein
MKNKIAFASAFFAAASFSTAEIVVNDFLSFEGFVDMSYAHSDADIGTVNEAQNSYDIDQVEISWLFDFDTVTAQIDLAHEGTDGDNSVVEQAFVNYHLENGAAVTAGRFGSMLGFEAFEPTGLYQDSFAYSGGIALDQLVGPGNDSDMSVLPGYDHGVKYTLEGEATFFGIALLDGDYNRGRLGGDVDGVDADSGYGVEAAYAQDLGNGFSYFLGARFDEGDTADSTTFNAYTTYETGAWLFAAEVAYSEENADAANSDEEGLNALLMANYAYSDQASVTGRLSYAEKEEDTAGGSDETDFFKYTIAHNYAFTDNLLLVNELSYVDGDSQDAGAAAQDIEEVTFAVSLLFTF